MLAKEILIPNKVSFRKNDLNSIYLAKAVNDDWGI